MGGVFSKAEFRLWKENYRLRKYQPKNARAKIIIAAMGANGFRTRGKVSPRKFFPPFCRVLAACGISSAYVNDFTKLERELTVSREKPIILVNLVNEEHDNLQDYDFPETVLDRVAVTFNSHRVATIIRDKKETNLFLSRNNILMPSLSDLKDKTIFSNANIGSQERVLLYTAEEELDSNRYNVEFIDTRIQFEEAEYYTCIRLMCIGSRLVQVYVRARDVYENDPSVHSLNTPRDSELLNYLDSVLVAPRVKQLCALAEDMGSALGPGFYAHDALVDNVSGGLYLCETGFKFFDGTYSNHMMGVISQESIQRCVVDQETYAAYAASLFVTYCAEKGFL